MLLSDRDITSNVESDIYFVIEPFEPGQVQSASYDFRLGGTFRTVSAHSRSVIDPFQPQTGLWQSHIVGPDDEFILHPGQFALATTLERFGLPDNIAGQVGGKSSLGRLGLQVHSTAGFIDPGFMGHITLELSNVAVLPIVLRPGMLIGQIVYIMLVRPAAKPYDGKYQGQTDATESLYHLNYAGAEHAE